LHRSTRWESGTDSDDRPQAAAGLIGCVSDAALHRFLRVVIVIHDHDAAASLAAAFAARQMHWLGLLRGDPAQQTRPAARGILVAFSPEVIHSLQLARDHAAVLGGHLVRPRIAARQVVHADTVTVLAGHVLMPVDADARAVLFLSGTMTGPEQVVAGVAR